MNCREVKRQTRGGALQSALVSEVRAHLEACAQCRRRTSLDRLGASLIRAYAEPRADEGTSPRSYFFTRLRARINEGRATDASLNFWEAAVIAGRGWLLAFGAVAALLFAASLSSLHLQASRYATGPDLSVEALALPSGSENILIANGESLSHDAVLMTLVPEDQEHGRK